jgi:endonuclease III
VQPILKSSIALESLFEAIATTSMSEALVYSRTHPEHTREMLFRQLIAFALRSQTNEEVQRRTSELVFSTLDSTEEAWLEDYLSTDNSHTSKKSKDTLLVRRIICDRFAEAEKQKAGNHWADLLQGIKEGIHGQEE